MRTITRDVFYTTTKVLVLDALSYYNDNKTKYQNNGMPYYDYQYLKIQSHRAIGNTYTALRLQQDFPTSCVICWSYNWKRDILTNYKSRGYPSPDPHNTIDLNDVMTTDWERGKKFKLGIIETGEMVKSMLAKKQLDMSYIHLKLFWACDIVVELS